MKYFVSLIAVLLWGTAIFAQEKSRTIEPEYVNYSKTIKTKGVITMPSYTINPVRYYRPYTNVTFEVELETEVPTWMKTNTGNTTIINNYVVEEPKKPTSSYMWTESEDFYDKVKEIIK